MPEAHENHQDCPLLRVKERQASDGTLLLAIEGELDIATGGPFRKRVRELRGSETHAILDLSGLEFIDCCGLRTLLEVLQVGDDTAPTLALSPDYPAALRRLLELIDSVGLGEEIYPDIRLPPTPAHG